MKRYSKIISALISLLALALASGAMMTVTK
jgi:hypothetical protein